MSFNDKLKSMAMKAIEKMRILAHCTTCGILFLDISGKDYLTLSSHFKDGTPDKWFVETGIHWVENEGHLIIVEFINESGSFLEEDICKIWENKLKLDQSKNPEASKDLQRPHFYKYRERCKDKPI